MARLLRINVAGGRFQVTSAICRKTMARASRTITYTIQKIADDFRVQDATVSRAANWHAAS